MTATVDTARTTGSGRHTDDYEHLTPLLVELHNTKTSGTRRTSLRDELAAGYLPVAEHIALRFRHRGEPVDDLSQVAAVGLLNAIDRFDPGMGKDFLSYAVPTITGEVRRYFRDHSWSMRVPRRLKELRTSVHRAMTTLTAELGRAPTAGELATHLDVSTEEILESYQINGAYRTSSLDELASDDSNSTMDDFVGSADSKLSMVDDQQMLYPALAKLPERQRAIVWMRFFDHLTQSQIAERVNISQMHVSRLLAKSLVQLRAALGEQQSVEQQVGEKQIVKQQIVEQRQR